MLVRLETPNKLPTYKLAKDVIINVFGVKPACFAGLTESKGSFSFLLEYKAMKAYLTNKPHPEAGRIVPWTNEHLLNNRSEAIVIASKVAASKATNRSLLKDAKALLEVLSLNEPAKAFEFIYAESGSGSAKL